LADANGRIEGDNTDFRDLSDDERTKTTVANTEQTTTPPPPEQASTATPNAPTADKPPMFEQ
jgi:hypothetical protein